MNTEILFAALSTKRRSGGPGEAAFVAFVANRLNPTMIDEIGNLHFDRTGGTSKTLFIAHTDTISRGKGPNKFIVEGGMLKGDGDTLGADDGAGVALLAHLMESDVPGYYILARQEECGGLGSQWLAENAKGLLQEFDRAIAFDRRGYSDVITHQAHGKCASNEFANGLCDQLNNQGLLYMPSDGGVFTDTANFVDIIPECTNVACGYDHEHGDKEQLNLTYLLALADAVVKVDWEALPTVRKPGDDGHDDLPVWRSYYRTSDRDMDEGLMNPLTEELSFVLQDFDTEDLLELFDQWGFNQVLTALKDGWKVTIGRHISDEHREAALAWQSANHDALRKLAHDKGERHVAEALMWACDTDFLEPIPTPEGAMNA